MHAAKRPRTRTSGPADASAASARNAGRWVPERGDGGGAPDAGPTCVPMMRSAAAAMKPSVTGAEIARTRNPSLAAANSSVRTQAQDAPEAAR